MTMPRPSRRATPAVNAEPNVIPFIDVMLVLLIIFMVAAPKPTTSLAVNMASGPVVYRPAPVVPVTVSIARDGALFIEGEAVTRANFHARLLTVARQRNPAVTDMKQLFAEAGVHITADQSVSYDAVFGVVNDIDAAGFKKVNLMVQDADI